MLNGVHADHQKRFGDMMVGGITCAPNFDLPNFLQPILSLQKSYVIYKSTLYNLKTKHNRKYPIDGDFSLF